MPILLVGVSMLIFCMLSLLTPYERASLYIRISPSARAPWTASSRSTGWTTRSRCSTGTGWSGKKDPDTGEIKGGVLRGDLGLSKSGSSTVAEVIGRRLPATVELALWAAIPMIGIGIWLGVMSAVNHNKPIDQILRVSASSAGRSPPLSLACWC